MSSVAPESIPANSNVCTVRKQFLLVHGMKLIYGFLVDASTNMWYHFYHELERY